MARFVPGTTIETEARQIEVDGGLPAGRYLFQLVVVDNEGNESEPARLVVTVRRSADTGGSSTGPSFP